ncbi:MAG: hypothetical protein HYU70_18090 [Bacteroidetes bacterium]|nr:hypothetical protein [Bacteroidota bacterium]
MIWLWKIENRLKNFKKKKMNIKNLSKGLLFVYILIQCNEQIHAQATNKIDTLGNIGVGTTNPEQHVEINKTGGGIIRLSNPKQWESGYGTNGTEILGKLEFFSFDESTYGSSVRSYISSVMNSYYNVTSMIFANGPYDGPATERMRIDNGGNVGIGTSNPFARLNVLDPNKNSTALVIGRGIQAGQANLPNTYGYPYVRIGGGEYDNNYNNLTKQTIGFGYMPGGYSPVEIGVEIKNWSSSGTADIVFATRPDDNNVIPTERVRITNMGYMGIGTTMPTEKLSVNGNVRAKKIIVSQTGWSDYVFNADYKLKSLPEVEAFIKENKHLPEVPSAKEVEEKGISVGDNQALLLKKIEELTLYVIELKRENIEQQKEINQLKKAK